MHIVLLLTNVVCGEGLALSPGFLFRPISHQLHRLWACKDLDVVQVPEQAVRDLRARG
jgi:hypothetical protein